MPRFTSALAASLLLLTIARAPAFGCSCIDLSLEQAIERSDAVFVGKVIRLEVLRTEGQVDTVRATLAPLRVVKGSIPREVEFTTNDGCCYCAFWFEIAATYLIFATGSDGHLETSTCSRSAKVLDAADDMRALGLEDLLPDPNQPGA